MYSIYRFFLGIEIPPMFVSQNKSMPSAWQPFAELRCLGMGSVEKVSWSPKDYSLHVEKHSKRKPSEII